VGSVAGALITTQQGRQGVAPASPRLRNWRS
jgi:hypothetical protein